MKVLSYAKACDIVDYYNASYCTRLVAEQVKLSRQVVYEVIDWLFNREYLREIDLANTATTKKLLPELTKERWCEYLYSHDVSPEDAARALHWELSRVLESCRGAAQWRKESNRERCFRKKPERPEPVAESDPTEEEILAAAAEVRETWAESRFGVQQPYEAPQMRDLKD